MTSLMFKLPERYEAGGKSIRRQFGGSELRATTLCMYVCSLFR